MKIKMKKHTISSIILFLFLHLNSFGQSYTSLTMSGEFIKLELTRIENEVHVSRITTQGNNTIGMRIYNLTDIPFQENRIEIPENGKFWWIPFEENEQASVLKPYTTYCYECSTSGGCYNSSCVWKNVGGGCQQCQCASGGQGECFVTRCPCDSQKNKANGGGIIISAEKIVIE